MPHTTTFELIAEHAAQAPERAVFIAPDRPVLSYCGLHRQVQTTCETLNRFGVGRGDAVAVVLPNGPEMAAVFAAVASCAAVAPLNPRYRSSEFEFYLGDLDARALLVLDGTDSPSVDVAKARGIDVITLRVDPGRPAGEFELVGRERDCARPGPAQCDDVALILHTSGTTSRPKMVPLTQSNVMTSGHNIATTLALSSQDRCLNVMPLFHIHGLMAAVLASLHAGASVACTAGFFAPRFFEWLSDHQPTWYTAVPTMHQAILSRADRHRDVIAASQLRLIRSSSASLPPQVIEALESVFAVPVIEAYGMTEAAHQIASNPLPPAARKPGSVGLAAGPHVQIMAADGDQILGPNETGEVVIRGSNVTRGYAANAAANATAFVGEWFRTGDQGYLDADGYLYLTGRLKEIINRGGEKISPREVDEVLLDHPAVRQAIAFAIPDQQLGEEVAAAVVLADGANVSDREIREFAAERLADFKVPKRVVILDEIPTGATGKLQRIGLAAALGIDSLSERNTAAPFVEPEGEIEIFLAEMWTRVLRSDRIGRHHEFLSVGGDSILAAQLVTEIRTTLGIEITILDFFDAPTIAQQAQIVEQLLRDDEGERDTHRVA